jgi:hypothetical protein
MKLTMRDQKVVEKVTVFFTLSASAARAHNVYNFNSYSIRIYQNVHICYKVLKHVMCGVTLFASI